MRDAQRKHLLEILKEPKTYQEVADIAGVHYVSARRYIMELIRREEVIEMPTKRDGHLMFVANYAKVKDGLMLVALGDKLVALPELAELLARKQYNLNKYLGSLIAQVWVKAMYSGTDKAHLEGIKTPIEMKADLRQLAGALRRVVKAVDQLLDADALWEDGRKPALLFGEVDPVNMVDLAEFYMKMSNAEKTGR